MEIIKTFDQSLLIPELRVPVYQCGVNFSSCPLFDPAPDFKHLGEEVINPADVRVIATARQVAVRY